MTLRLSKLWHWVRSESAATAVEYAVMVSIIVAAAASIAVLGTSTDDRFHEANKAFDGKVGTGGGSGSGPNGGSGGGAGGGGGFCG